jgi:hypothetical protein
VSDEQIFSRRVIVGLVAGAVGISAASLYFILRGETGGPESSGANSFSRSAIGHAGIADVLQRLGITVVKSRHSSLEKLSPGSVLVIAEPRRARQSEEEIRSLLKAERVLLVLPKWSGEPSARKRGWLKDAKERSIGDARWALALVAPRAEVMRESAEPRWTRNELGPEPTLMAPAQLLRGLRPIVAAGDNVLIGEIAEGGRRLWVLSDPDLISNHGLAKEGNAALAVAMLERLRTGDGGVVFDETVHGYVAKPESPFVLLFRFPFVIATVQGALAVALLLWATMGRFGAPQTAPPRLSAGRGGLLQNMAQLIEYTGHQPAMVARYVQATVLDVARQLHAPRGLSRDSLVAWLQRVGNARATTVDCGELVAAAGEVGGGGRADARALARLAQDTHRWRREILDGR